MTDAKRREAARQFYQKWANRGREDEDDRSYWIDFLQDVIGVDHVTDRIEFQKKVIGPDGNTKRIDAYIPETGVLIEQKSLNIDLAKPQQGHDGMTPYEQAKMYDNSLPHSEKARWIVLSNFGEIWVYDMEARKPEPLKFHLSEIPAKFSQFEFLVNKEQKKISREMEVSVKAGEFVGLIYDALYKQYINPDNEKSQKSLNMLCVRLVFCLYAEDAHIFGDSGHMFHDYLDSFETKDMRKALIELFHVLDTPEDKRDPYDTSGLNKFPYVNGGLFEREDIEIPNITEEIREILLTKASDGFDWSMISPTIFGAVFESTLNPETRRSGGMHYTSIENIHKVIDPLFLDDLKSELAEIQSIQVEKTRNVKLKAFQDKLASLKWLDPACGSGNFLTETYISIRRLENEIIKTLKGGQMQFITDEEHSPIKVGIDQFYGIEINDFAVTVAKTALWIAESQMMKETEDILLMQLNFLPLTTNATIIEGNALRMDWRYLHDEERQPLIKAKKTNLISPDDIDPTKPIFVAEEGMEYDEVNLITEELHVGKNESLAPENHYDYIMGNPPFVGTNWLSDEQRKDMNIVWGDTKRGKLDYVTCWYVKAAEYIGISDRIRCAFVSTNSVCQGEQAVTLWKKMLIEEEFKIIFAVNSFVWNSESSQKASVHVVIVSFSHETEKKAKLYDGNTGEFIYTDNINGYLLPAPTIVIEERSLPICEVPSIVRGSQATDNGYYLFEKKEYEYFIEKEPQSKEYFRRFMMGKEFINNIERWCLWIPDIPPEEIKQCPMVFERVKAVKSFREQSKNEQTNKAALVPQRFGQYRPPAKQYIAFAKVSSEKRRYIPMGFLTDEVIPGDKLFTIPNADLFMFGILMSNVHNAWMRTVCGRLKSDYSYSTTIVYNNFPWCTPSNEQREKIEKTAKSILDARLEYPNSSLADLYDDVLMPKNLRSAHTENDKAVMQAYGFSVKDTSEADCVAALMKMYQELTAGEH